MYVTSLGRGILLTHVLNSLLYMTSLSPLNAQPSHFRLNNSYKLVGFWESCA